MTTAPVGLPPAAARMLALLYTVSGATGLCYEVLWARMLTGQFGLSTFGVAATVTAFLLGLGAGAALAARRQDRYGPAAALRRYAALEAIIALYALALPAISSAGSPLLDSLAPHLAWWQWCALQGAVAVLLLAVPAAAMGASFPLVLSALPATPQGLGNVYALNTLGAAAGALLGLVLLAAVGWDAALHAVALAGAVVAAGAAALARHSPDRPSRPRPWPAPAVAASPATRWAPATRQLLGYAGVGAAALMIEITWTRLYGLVLLRTEYVLAVILAVYLAGTAIGSGLAARCRFRLDGIIALAACSTVLLGLAGLAPLSAWMQAQRFGSLGGALAAQSLALAACTLPATVALGAWLPVLARRTAGTAPSAAYGMRLYAANCAGGAFGTLLAVLVLIPVLGAAATLALAAVLLLALGLVLGAPRRLLLALPVAAAVAAGVHRLPSPERLLGSGPSVERFRYEDALTLTQVIETPDGQRILLTDLQHLDASSDPAAVPLQADQARLPLLLHAAPHSVLFLGLGTGISASGSLAYADLARSAVEISPGAVTAARDWFGAVNGGVVPLLRIDHDDARHYLAATNRRFDVIVGDLFHPDVAGSGSLLSVEQFSRARARLAPGGIFTQWLAINQFDGESLRVVLRSFQHVFPQGQLFLDGAHLALVGAADGPVHPGAVARATASDGRTGGEGGATWLGRYWGPIAAGSGPLQRETRPVIEFRLPRLRYDDGAVPIAEILRELLRQRPDAATAAQQLGIAPADRGAFAGAFAASELAVRSWLALLDGDGGRAAQLVRLAYESNPLDRWIASSLADDLWQGAIQDGPEPPADAIERVLRVYPEHVEALRARWHRERRANPAAPAAAAARERLRAVAPLDAELRAIGVPLS